MIKNVIKIEVRGSEKPYSAYGRYYMRSADEDRELSPTALKELMDRQTSSDILTLIPAPVQTLTFNKLKIAFVTAGLTVDQTTFEDNTGLKNSDGKYNLMAFLLADENDISIKVATFAGKDKTDLVKRNEYGGTCLVTAIDKVIDYVEQPGHGIPLIISNYGKQAFDIMENFVNVTIPYNFEKKNSDGTDVDNDIIVAGLS